MSQNNSPYDGRFSFIAIPPHQKSPIAKGWNLIENCITTASDAWRLDGNNIALATAYCSPVIAHLDIDNYKLAKSEFAAIGLDLEKFLKKSDTAIFTSGRPQSLGLLYSLPESLEPQQTEVWKVGDVVAYEIRCMSATKNTSASVIPDSMHPRGTKYRWVQGDLTTITEMPSELLVHWLKTNDEPKKQKENARESAVVLNFGYESPRKLALLRQQLRYIDPDCDYPTWRDVIWAILSTGYASAYSIARDWSEGAPHRYNYLHFLNTVESFRPGHFTLGTVYHYARLGGWNG